MWVYVYDKDGEFIVKGQTSDKVTMGFVKFLVTWVAGKRWTKGITFETANDWMDKEQRPCKRPQASP
jgi:hypothetical protein